MRRHGSIRGEPKLSFRNGGKRDMRRKRKEEKKTTTTTAGKL